MTEVQNTENAEMTENAESVNDENSVSAETPENAESTETAEPTFEMPTAENLDFGDPLLTSLGQQILSERGQLLDVDGLLQRQKSDFSDEKMLEYAENSEDPALKRAFDTYKKQLDRLASMRSDLIGSVGEKLGGEKLSDDEIKAKREQRKTISDTIDMSKGVISNILPQKQLPKETEEYILTFLENIKIPGSRASKGTGSDSGTTAPKPRLNGGTVNVGNQNHPNFPQAASHLTKQIGEEIPAIDLINAWVDAANVGNWKDTPEIVEFNFRGHDIKVVKLPKKPKSSE